ncbi:MAG: amino acid ABC transporter permease [Alphaproteobacteria bacterium]|nr:amino acid ABC transporter permease [Alphaproteobacteria bacterium]
MDYWRFDTVLPHLGYLLAGVSMTIQVSLAAVTLAVAVGLVVAMLRLSSIAWVRAAAGLYVDIWRSTPTLAQLLWVFYALPILTGVPLSVFVAGTITLGCHYGAYLAEIFRAGILALPTGQAQAARALGMTEPQVLRRIVLPQAVTIMLPTIASQFISLFKESALVSMISLEELMWHAQSLAGFTMRSVEVFTTTALIYMALTYPQTLLVNRLHRRALAAQAGTARP